MFHQRSFSTVQYKITATLTPDKSHAMSSNKQFVKIVGTRGETEEEECLGNFNVNPGDEVTCKLRSKLYVPHSSECAVCFPLCLMRYVVRIFQCQLCQLSILIKLSTLYTYSTHYTINYTDTLYHVD